ncbi:RDD family protein [Congregibacter litoralis]|uniref:Putative membrane protein/domain protein n=1 Tax=Congregibacter litoralis KT71 TaxID=314285 RepID=A4A3Y0_9GAMM|nr:RDD family protein [Congregibacter litoralis]EAQ99403.1 putative membrane protein/domain protein [Congregibacter litoralis KT71]
MNTDTLPAPALPRRLAAIVYDSLLVIPLIMVCVAIGLGIRQLLGSAADSLLPATVVQMIAVFSCIGFFGVFWLKSGQTLGMQAWRLKLVPMPGNELSFGRVVTRCLSALLSALCLGLGYWWCLFDKRKRCWHDYLSGTELVLLPKKSKKSKKPEKNDSGQGTDT